MKSNEPAGTGSALYSTRTKGSVRLRPVELGDLHPAGRCSWCGSRESSSTLKQVALLWTAAPAVVCVDPIACARRREIQRRAA